MAAHAELATDMGLGSARVVNGDVLHLSDSGAIRIATVQTGRLGLSGQALSRSMIVRYPNVAPWLTVVW